MASNPSISDCAWLQTYRQSPWFGHVYSWGPSFKRMATEYPCNSFKSSQDLSLAITFSIQDISSPEQMLAEANKHTIYRGIRERRNTFYWASACCSLQVEPFSLRSLDVLTSGAFHHFTSTTMNVFLPWFVSVLLGQQRRSYSIWQVALISLRNPRRIQILRRKTRQEWYSTHWKIEMIKALLKKDGSVTSSALGVNASGKPNLGRSHVHK